MAKETIVPNKVESLEDAAKDYFLNKYSYLDSPSWSFTLGATWQKEQLQPLVASHAELLKLISKFLKGFEAGDHHQKTPIWNKEIFQSLQSAIEKAKQITL